MKKIMLKLIRIYQKTISPDHGLFTSGTLRCRFYPSCSEYCYQVIEKRGIFKGVVAGIYRIIRCNPWSSGGTDMVD
jgi:uncharacterized protein